MCLHSLYHFNPQFSLNVWFLALCKGHKYRVEFYKYCFKMLILHLYSYLWHLKFMAKSFDHGRVSTSHTMILTVLFWHCHNHGKIYDDDSDCTIQVIPENLVIATYVGSQGNRFRLYFFQPPFIIKVLFFFLFEIMKLTTSIISWMFLNKNLILSIDALHM